MEKIKRDLFLKVAWSYHGTFYTWGGDDPSGFDCSGLAVECLKSVGKLPRKGDWTAAGLYHKFSDSIIRKPCAGCLAFWKGSRGQIIHVEICVDNTHSIGASGGGSRTITRQDAIRHNAFIKVRPVLSRSHIGGFVDPFEGEGE